MAIRLPPQGHVSTKKVDSAVKTTLICHYSFHRLILVITL